MDRGAWWAAAHGSQKRVGLDCAHRHGCYNLINQPAFTEHYIFLSISFYSFLRRSYWKGRDNLRRLAIWKHPETTLKSS